MHMAILTSKRPLFSIKFDQQFGNYTSTLQGPNLDCYLKTLQRLCGWVGPSTPVSFSRIDDIFLWLPLDCIRIY